MLNIPHEIGDIFCQSTNGAGGFIVIAIFVHFVVFVYSSKSVTDFLDLLFNPFSKKAFILSWVAIFLIIPALLIVSLFKLLCK